MSFYYELIQKIINKYNLYEQTLQNIEETENPSIPSTLDRAVSNLEEIKDNSKQISDNIKKLNSIKNDLKNYEFDLILTFLGLQQLKEFLFSNKDIITYEKIKDLIKIVDKIKKDLQYHTYNSNGIEELEYTSSLSNLEEIYVLLNDIRDFSFYSLNKLDANNDINEVITIYEKDINNLVDNLEAETNIAIDLITNDIIEIEETLKKETSYFSFELEEFDPILYDSLISTHTNYDNWVSKCLELKIFNSEEEAKIYFLNFLYENYKFLSYKLWLIFNKNKYILENLYTNQYYYITENLKFRKGRLTKLTEDDFILTNTKTFSLSLLFPSLNLFYNTKLNDLIDLDTYQIPELTENDFLFCMVKDFIILNKPNKDRILNESINIIMNYISSKEEKTLTECIFISILLLFMEELKIMSTLESDFSENLNQILQDIKPLIEKDIEHFCILYKDIFINKTLITREYLKNLNENKLQEFFNYILLTNYSGIVQYLNYDVNNEYL
jgi:hypothetical protein